MDAHDDSGDIVELSRRAQALLAAGSPAEAAGLLGELIDRLDREGSGDPDMRADLARLHGNALRESGDLAGSTRALESSISTLRSAPLSASRDMILALSLRSVALNYDASREADKASGARGEVLELAGSLIGRLPEDGAAVALALAEDLEAAGRADWRGPVDWLAGKAAGLDAGGALQVGYDLARFWLRRDDAGAAGRALGEALSRVRALDDEGVKASREAVYSLGLAAIEANAADEAQEIADRLERVLDAADTGAMFEVRRLRGLIAGRAGQGDAAVAGMQAAYDLALKAFGEEDARTRGAHRELADTLAATDHADRAIDAYHDALEVELRLGQDRLAAADIADASGRLLDNAFRYAEAHDMHRLALRIRNELLGPYHPDTNASRYEVAELSRVLDWVEEAELFYLQALQVENRIAGPRTRFSALIRNNLGELYEQLGRYDEARPLLEEALAIRSELYGDQSALAWRSRKGLALLETDGGDAGWAVDTAREALARPELADAGSWMMALARALLKAAQFEEAERRFRQLHDAVRPEMIGTAISWPAYLEVVRGLTVCQAARGEWAGAAGAASEVLNIARRSLPSLVQDASEMELARSVGAIAELQSLWLTALSNGSPQDTDGVKAALELAQITKGLLTRYLRWRQPGLSNAEIIAPPENEQAIREIGDEMRRLQDELTAEYLRLGSAQEFARSQPALARRARLRELEREMAGGITDGEVSLDIEPILADGLLPDGAMGLEFVVVRDVVPGQGGSAPAGQRYMAFALGPAGHDVPELVDLGLRLDVDRAVQDLRDSVMSEPWLDGGREPTWSRLGRFLGRKLLAPVWSRIEAARHVLIAPDGGLGALPFEILGTPDGAMLLDRVQVSYLSRIGDVHTRAFVFRKGDEPLILAGPDFDLPNAFTGYRQSLHGADRIVAGSLGETARFEPLPQARAEGESVGALLGVEPLLGVWALAPELLHSRSPEIIHLSTHGFCLPLEKTVDDVLVLAGPLGNELDRRTVLEDPMQRSGLALSGANAVLDGRSIPPEAGAAFVYAADIQQVNLLHTDMVVLSACRSGLGDLQIGDGAHGLRRAFLAAGCRSVVSALWDIPEESSRKMFECFYESVLKGDGRLEALSKARASVRAEHPRDPVHWAGLVLDGSFAPLWRFSGLADLTIGSLSFKEWGIRTEDDTEAAKRLAERIARGPALPPDELKWPLVSILNRVLARGDVDREFRAWALARHGDIANRLGDNDRALADYRALLAMDGRSTAERAAYGYNVAKISHQAGRVDEAIAGYSELLGLSPSARERSMIRVNRGYAYLQTGRIDEAVADFTAVIDDPEAPADQRYMAYTNRSEALSDGDPGRALQDAEAALALGVADEGETRKVRAFRAGLLMRLGRRGEALQEMADLE